jgi:type III restriction enzyme
LLNHWYSRGEWDPDSKRWNGGPRPYPFYY